jgi:hypothetical protein
MNFISGQMRDLVRRGSKIACLSENINSIVMWAHYADNHKGFALEYDFKNNSASECNKCDKRKECDDKVYAEIYPIIYGNKRFDGSELANFLVGMPFSIINAYKVNYYDILADKSVFEKMLLHKSKEWSYEKEWRIICPYNKQNQDNIKLFYKPKAIYYGMRIPPTDKKKLSELAIEKGIQQYEMYIKDDRKYYVLDYKKIM